MDLTTIGLSLIVVGIGGAWITRILRNRRNKTIAPSFESLYDNERLEQLINIAGGDSIAQMVRLYNIRGTDLAFANQGTDLYKIRSLTRDRILLFHEINRLNKLQQEKTVNYSLIPH
jgi:hypothetical protein